ncbi:MAG: hypothetical protein ACI33P_01305, partial [Lysinibacillus sp.]
FPSVSATFSYMLTADGYTLGIFLAILAVVLMKEFKYGFIERIGSWATVLLIFLTIFNFGLIANISCFNMELRNEKTINLAKRILDRTEQLDEYEAIEKITVFSEVSMYSELNAEIIPNRIPNMIGSTATSAIPWIPLRRKKWNESEKVRNIKKWILGLQKIQSKYLIILSW